MMMIIENLKLPNQEISECTVWESTDGCSKQYRCANALHLLSVLAVKYTVIIDRSVSAPGHGNSIIDGLNAVDKHYLRKVMYMSSSMYLDDEERIMNAHSMTETASQSFAEECVRLCSQSDHENGVFDSKKNEGKENKGKLTTRFYHLHKQEDVTYDKIHKDSYGFGRFPYGFRRDSRGFIWIQRFPTDSGRIPYRFRMDSQGFIWIHRDS